MPTVLPLSKLVDLALGTPEVGAVNFNVLHTLLHAMITKLNLNDAKAEINDSDRDFLSSSKPQRILTALSDIDSGKGEDSEDALSEFRDSSETDSTPVSSATRKSKRPVPYHHLELRVEKLAEQLESLNALPSTSDLLERAKAKGDGERPVAEMWQYMQLKKRVDANEDGVGKLMSLVEDLMKEMQVLRDANADLINKVNSLDIDDLKKKLAELEKITSDLNDKFSTLPTPDEYVQFVTWPLLEDSLKGVRKDMEGLSQSVTSEKEVVESAIQTDPKVASRPPSSHRVSSHHVSSRPPSSRPLSRLSNTSSGPTDNLLDVLERLGKLSEDHDSLAKRVQELEDQLKNKLDKDALENLNLSSDLLEQLNKLKEELDALQAMREKDREALLRAQQAIPQLQVELEKVQTTTKEVISENQHRSKQIESLLKYCDTLQENKADKEHVAMEIDVKADKRQLENKVNHSLFDSTTGEINRLIKEILDKLDGQDSGWKDAFKELAEDVEGKLDRLEIEPLKEWLENRLKALNKKIMANAHQEWGEDDAAGLRKQLIQRFNCLSCDRPVDLMPTGPVPSLPSQNAMPSTRSPRPYTTFELEQIRQHAKSFNNQDVSDYYATMRQCGGSHTLTYPHKRVSRMTQMNNLFKDEVEEHQPTTPVYPVYKEEVDVQGVDGHIYRGRMERVQIEAKMPSKMTGGQQKQATGTGQRLMQKFPQTESVPFRNTPTPPTNMRGRPMSARGTSSPRPSSGRPMSRQQSRPVSARQSGQESSRTTPFQDDSYNQTDGADQGQTTVVEAEAIRVDVPTPDIIEEPSE